MNKLRKHEKGFTLVEILIAVSLLAILAAIVVPNLTGLMGRGSEEAYKADKKAIQVAVDTYYTDPQNRWKDPTSNNTYRQYPTWSQKGLMTNGANGGSSDTPGTSSATNNTSYIKFEFLAAQGLLDPPASAHPVQNGSTAYTGNYGWYVDRSGKVQSSPAYAASIGFP